MIKVPLLKLFVYNFSNLLPQIGLLKSGSFRLLATGVSAGVSGACIEHEVLF